MKINCQIVVLLCVRRVNKYRRKKCNLKNSCVVQKQKTRAPANGKRARQVKKDLQFNSSVCSAKSVCTERALSRAAGGIFTGFAYKIFYYRPLTHDHHEINLLPFQYQIQPRSLSLFLVCMRSSCCCFVSARVLLFLIRSKQLYKEERDCFNIEMFYGPRVHIGAVASPLSLAAASHRYGLLLLRANIYVCRSRFIQSISHLYLPQHLCIT
jgi:hypothetical protein